jgi:hypothetical protein
MTRAILAAFLISALVPAFSITAQAQTKKPKGKCVPIETCIKTCGERGGQIRLCPKYCNDQARMRGC